MSAFNVYLSYLTYDGYSDFIDITGDVVESSIRTIKERLEADEFNVGQITFDSLNLVLRNEHSLYSEATNASSIFPLKRDNSKIKVTFDINSYGSFCGNCACGHTFLSPEKDIFEGLLEENTASFDVEKQEITFKILGLDSVIKKQITPFASLSVSDDANTLVYKILNQTEITKFFTVDVSNINCNYNFIPDSIAHLEERSCQESLQDILTVSNSIMYVRGGIIYVNGRIPSVDSKYTFYSSSSNLGIENIIKISKYGIGLNRTFNFWKWEDSNTSVSFVDSIGLYGLRKKEISSELITDTSKRTAVLNSYLSEFGFPKTELMLSVPIYTDITDLGFLDKINIDFPSDVLPVIDETASRYNQAKYDSGFNYNVILNSLFISISTNWKILNRTVNLKDHTIEFKVREI